MKLIIGGSGEGKTQRVIELASELTKGKTTSTIYSFEDSPLDIGSRVVKYMNENNIDGQHLVDVHYLDSVSEEKLVQLVKESSSDLIFIDGLRPSRLEGSFEGTLTDLYSKISKVEGKIRKGILLTAQRMPVPNKKGINIIDFGVDE
jgi:predicted ATP-dependent serine protease